MIAFTPTNTGFMVEVTVNGPTLNAALMNVVVPSSAGFLRRVTTEGQIVTTGKQLDTAQAQIDASTIEWHEQLTVPGFRTRNRFFFEVDTSAVPATIDVEFKVGGEQLGGWVHSTVPMAIRSAQ